MWEARHCRNMTSSEHSTLEHGCIGVTALNLGTGGRPDLNNSYATLEQAKRRAQEMKRECSAKGQKPRIFSQRFYSGGKSDVPDPVTGRVDMSGYDYKAKPGYVNFDYGWYDEQSDSWWHANHYETHDPDDPMVVYRSTLDYYSRPLIDFDSQVFCVACGP